MGAWDYVIHGDLAHPVKQSRICPICNTPQEKIICYAVSVDPEVINEYINKIDQDKFEGVYKINNAKYHMPRNLKGIPDAYKDKEVRLYFKCKGIVWGYFIINRWTKDKFIFDISSMVMIKPRQVPAEYMMRHLFKLEEIESWKVVKVNESNQGIKE